MKCILIAALAAAALGCATSASAEVVYVTYETQVAINSSNGLNLFGGGDLVGDAATFQFQLDTNVGARTGDTQILGGTFYSQPSPMQSATLTINGQTISIGTGWADLYRIAVGPGPSNNEIDTNVKGYTSRGLENGGIGILYTGIGSIDQTYLAINNPNGGFWNVYDPSNGNVLESLNFSASGDGSLFNATSVAPESSAVPEPGTWALLLAGLGGVGALMRRRARAPAAQCAV